MINEIIEVARVRETLQQDLKQFRIEDLNEKITDLEGKQDVLQSQMSQA